MSSNISQSSTFIALTLTLVASLSALPATAQDDAKLVQVDGKYVAIDPQPIDKALFSENLWGMSIATFRTALPKHQFSWLSSAKTGLRAPDGTLTLLGYALGETNVRERDGEISSVNINLFNKGDHDPLNKQGFDSLVNEWKGRLSTHFPTRALDDENTALVDTNSWTWTSDATKFTLEASYNKGSNTAEFVRISLSPRNARPSRGETANRSSLRQNTTQLDNGDIIINGIPMVDQGAKGYCVNATIERVMRYYGRDIDQNELAQLFKSDRNGTSPNEMYDALKGTVGELNTRTLVLYEYPRNITEKTTSYRDYELGMRDYLRDVKRYNRAAKKADVKDDFPDSMRGGVYLPTYGFRSQADWEVFCESMADDTKFSLFQSKIGEYIDQGIPVCWALQLGLFKEGDGNQAAGGHMRLIVGYNSKTKEIIYSDSWGAGHEKKRVSMLEAFCASDLVVVLPPTR